MPRPWLAGLFLLVVGCASRPYMSVRIMTFEELDMEQDFCLGVEHLRCRPTPAQITAVYPHPTTQQIKQGGYVPTSHPGMPAFLAQDCLERRFGHSPSVFCSTLTDARRWRQTQ